MVNGEGPKSPDVIGLHTGGSPRFAADSAERCNTAAGSGQPQRRQVPTTNFRPSTVATGVFALTWLCSDRCSMTRANNSARKAVGRRCTLVPRSGQPIKVGVFVKAECTDPYLARARVVEPPDVQNLTTVRETAEFPFVELIDQGVRILDESSNPPSANAMYPDTASRGSDHRRHQRCPPTCRQKVSTRRYRTPNCSSCRKSAPAGSR